VRRFRVIIPPHVAAVIRSLPPDLKRPIKAAMRAMVADPEIGDPLMRELAGLQKFRVRRFRIVYAVNRRARSIQIMAVGHRRQVYDDIARQLAPRRRR
jgi:mRNA interferase RelE/StbE